MKFFTLYFSTTYWKYNWQNIVGTFFKAFGALFLIIRFYSHFRSQTEDWTRGHWGLSLACIAVSVIWTLIECRPMSLIRHKLNGKDVSIEIRISNIFDVKGALIISTNSTFDTDRSEGLISPDSLQGQFTERYYHNEKHLDSDIEESLAEQTPIELLTDWRKGKTERYEIGTVAKVRPKAVKGPPQYRLVYLVAIAHMDKDGKAESSFEEVIDGLGKLWNYIANRGELEPLVVGVIGTGLGRLAQTREEMIREIIGSFIAACSENRFAERLTIVISPEDYREYNIDLHELGNYLRHVCQYTDLKSKTDTGKGEAIP